MHLLLERAVYIVKVKVKNVNAKFLLALINSRLLSWYFSVKTNEFDRLFPQIKVTEFKDLPIRLTANQVPIINLVDKILSFIQSEDYLQNLKKKEKVKALEREIDQVVYELYGLTEEEIKSVEEKND